MSSSNLSFDPLRHPSTTSSLQTLTRILETCIGSMGHLKLLENTRELTSSSQRLLYHISIKNVFSKIIISTAKTQLRTFNDGGLFCALLTLKLVCPTSLVSGHSLPLLGTLYEHFAVDFLRLLKNESSLPVDFSDLRHLKSVVLTVLSSKPGCLLCRWDRDHLCSLLLRAFLDGIPSNGSAQVLDYFKFMTINGLPTKESRLLKGALLQIPETEMKGFLKELSRQDCKPFKVALFTCSLAGEADWPVEGLVTTSLNLVIGSTLQLLDSVVSRMVGDRVDCVFCQKVVHPRMKKQLQKARIMILDRLGSEAAKCLQYISGGNSIAVLSGEMSYGTISNISIEHLGGKSFLLLHSEHAQLFSIILTHYNEEASAELKVVCRQAMDSLLRILKSPRICFGGGCSEIRTSLLLANKVRSSLNAIKAETGCTAGQVLESLSTFQQSISSTCVAIHQGKALDFATESANGHLWKLHEGNFPTVGHRCQCGSHEAASVDPSTWSFLSDIGHLYKVIPPPSISSDKSSMTVLPLLTITDQSLEVLDSTSTDVQPKVAVSNNPMPAFQMPTSSRSSPKCVPSPNAIPRKSEPANTCTSPKSISTGVDLASAGLDAVCLDELSCRLNGLSLAFETAALLLKTTVCINNLPT